MDKRKTILAATLAVLLCLGLTAAQAAQKSVVLDGRVRAEDGAKAVPGLLNYQGYLVNGADSSAVNATPGMTFRLYDAVSGGAEQWSETHAAVQVSEGLFQVLLGSVTPFPAGLFDGSALWLQTEVGAEILSPRKPLVSVAYSHRSNSAEKLLNLGLTDLDGRWVNEGQPGSVTSAMIDDGQIVDDDVSAAAGIDPGKIAGTAWTVNNDGPGSGLNADLLDGQNASDFIGIGDLDHLDAADGTPANAVLVDADGKVGIGTASPLTELDVNGSVNASTYYGDGSNLTGLAGAPDADWTISGSDMYSGVSGNVGIGITAPAWKLDVEDYFPQVHLHDPGMGSSYFTVGVGAAGLSFDDNFGNESFLFPYGTPHGTLIGDTNGGITLGDWYTPRAGLEIYSDIGDYELWLTEEGVLQSDHAQIHFDSDQADWNLGVNSGTGIFYLYNGIATSDCFRLYWDPDSSQYDVELRHDVVVYDDFSVWGTKNFIQEDPIDPAKVIFYACLEGPESGTYLRGTAQITGGRVTIQLPDHFAKVTAGEDLTVQLTPTGQWLQLYVLEKSPQRIVVAEATGRDGTFDYLVQGVRKGQEDYQVVRDGRVLRERRRDAGLQGGPSGAGSPNPAQTRERIKGNIPQEDTNRDRQPRGQ